MFRWLAVPLSVLVLTLVSAAQADGLTFDGKLAEGHALYLAGDFEGAHKAYLEAKEMDSGRAEVYYYAGWALVGLEKVDDALASFGTAGTIAGSKDPALKGKALFSAAVVTEKNKDRAAAKEAWTEYLGFAQTNTDATVFVEVAKARIEALEKVIKLEADYAAVKEKMQGEGGGDQADESTGGVVLSTTE